MNLSEHLLQCLQEECSEIAIEASKSNRFGIFDYNPNAADKISNEERILREYVDLKTIVDICIKNGVLSGTMLDELMVSHRQKKIAKFKQSLLYSINRGRLVLPDNITNLDQIVDI